MTAGAARGQGADKRLYRPLGSKEAKTMARVGSMILRAFLGACQRPSARRRVGAQAGRPNRVIEAEGRAGTEPTLKVGCLVILLVVLTTVLLGVIGRGTVTPGDPSRQRPPDPVGPIDSHHYIPEGDRFYDPNRAQPYWANLDSKHYTREAAINALAHQFDRSPAWVLHHMGESNSLWQIHGRLNRAWLSEEM